MQRETTMAEERGSILLGMFWMFIISLLLFWLPGIGSLIAGIVGGKQAGGVLPGLLAALLPGVLIAIALFVSGTMLTALPMVGALLAGSGILLYLVYVPTLLIGALIGGLLV